MIKKNQLIAQVNRESINIPRQPEPAALAACSS